MNDNDNDNDNHDPRHDLDEALMQAQRAARKAEVDAHLAAWLASANEPVEYSVGWDDYMMSAQHWFSLIAVGPTDAAMLLCQFDPNTQTMTSAEQSTNDEIDPRKFAELRQRFVDLDANRPGPRSLVDWLLAARKMKVRYHSWIDKYVDARGGLGELQQSEPQADAPPQPVQRQRAQEAAILAKLAELGIDAQAVPLPPRRGKPSPAKESVRNALGYSKASRKNNMTKFFVELARPCSSSRHESYRA